MSKLGTPEILRQAGSIVSRAVGIEAARTSGRGARSLTESRIYGAIGALFHFGFPLYDYSLTNDISERRKALYQLAEAVFWVTTMYVIGEINPISGLGFKLAYNLGAEVVMEVHDALRSVRNGDSTATEGGGILSVSPWFFEALNPLTNEQEGRVLGTLFLHGPKRGYQLAGELDIHPDSIFRCLSTFQRVGLVTEDREIKPPANRPTFSLTPRGQWVCELARSGQISAITFTRGR